MGSQSVWCLILAAVEGMEDTHSIEAIFSAGTGVRVTGNSGKGTWLRAFAFPWLSPILYLIVYIYLLNVKAHLCKHTDAITGTDFDFPKYVSVVMIAVQKDLLPEVTMKFTTTKYYGECFFVQLIVNHSMFFRLDSRNVKHIAIYNWTLRAII